MLKYQRCKVVLTTIHCCRHEKKKQKVEPAAPQRRKTDEEKVSLKFNRKVFVLII